MRTIFSYSRYLIWIAVISLMLATFAVFIYGLISTAVIIFESFSHGNFGAEGARHLSVELIEMIDLFLLGTILFITAVGLQELFVDPGLKDAIPEWMSVSSLDELKFNLLAVVVVMLAIIFLGVAAGFELNPRVNILDYGLGIAVVVAAIGLTVFLFARVHGMRYEHKETIEDMEEQTPHTAE